VAAGDCCRWLTVAHVGGRCFVEPKVLVSLGVYPGLAEVWVGPVAWLGYGEV
jgi:hypothetical protein